jgi:hypothetical protein
MSVAIVVAGFIAKELGGRKREQVLAAVATAISPVSLSQGAVFQYVSFDYLWWVLLAYLLVRWVKSEDPRWWIAIGAVIGLGMQTKYTMVFFAAAVAGGVILTPARRYLRSNWLWAGVALSLVIFLPNLLWQIQHHFISLDQLQRIHARDVRIGRTKDFLPQQLWVAINVVTVPLAVLGLRFYCFEKEGERYRLLGWSYLLSLALFIVGKGRSYYLAPAYPMLLAAGSVEFGKWLNSLRAPNKRNAQVALWSAMVIGGVIFGALVMPVAPIGSWLWNVTSKLHDQFREEQGWGELAQNVARVYDSLSPEERARTGILTGNYGEAGALNLYGPHYGLPHAMSGTNSFWLRGYDPREPQTVILTGFDLDQGQRLFESCAVAAKNDNRYGIANEESEYHPQILLCRNLKKRWPEFWKGFRRFG